jgi:hypothetical protein
MQDTKRAGEIMVDNLLQQIRGEPTGSAMLPTRLIVRQSCGARLAQVSAPALRSIGRAGSRSR